MNRNKVQSFREDQLQNRLKSTKQRLAKHVGTRFAEVLEAEIALIEDVLEKKEFVPSQNEDGTPHAPYPKAHEAKLNSKEFAEKLKRKANK